ncbi:MAG: aminotransferase class IV [Luminiphilus sp.]|nr:aminotransferase class IV [Luminiphilus sp.]
MVKETFWVNGVANAEVPPDDRGLCLADGVFETLRVELGVVSCKRRHVQRLGRGLQVLNFPAPEQTALTLINEAEKALKTTVAHASGTLRLTVTRGSGPRGYKVPQRQTPRSILRFSPGLVKAESPSLVTVSRVRWSTQPFFQGCKLLARTEQVMALDEACRRGFTDAIMCDSSGSWVSTASGNLFLRVGTCFITPPVNEVGIAGTRREAILDHWAKFLGYQVSIRKITADLVASAEEAWSCNSVAGIRRIASVDDSLFPESAASEALSALIHQEASL